MVNNAINLKAGDGPNRRSGYVSAVAFNAILLFVLNRVPGWNIPLLTVGYREILWAIDLSLAVQIAGNFLLIFHHPPALHHQAYAAFNGVSAVAVFTCYRAFPFDFTPIHLFWIDDLVRILLVFTLITTVGAGIVHLVKGLELLASPRRNY